RNSLLIIPPLTSDLLGQPFSQRRTPPRPRTGRPVHVGKRPKMSQKPPSQPLCTRPCARPPGHVGKPPVCFRGIDGGRVASAQEPGISRPVSWTGRQAGPHHFR